MNANDIPAGDYITVGGINIWWQPAHPTRVHYVTNDSTFTDAQGSRPGIRIVFSDDPMSADYSPANFNRCSRALRAAGKPAPPEDVPELSRRLRDRFVGPLDLRDGYERPQA